MGIYINPPNMEKQAFLREKGIHIEDNECPPETHTREVNGQKQVAVCLVDNGWMTAAGIMYSKQELDDWSDFEDTRPKEWFWVPLNELEPYLNGVEI